MSALLSIEGDLYMKVQIFRAVSIGTAFMMFVSATASGLQAIVPTLASAAGQALHGHPGTFTDLPVPLKLAGRLSRDPETRGGAWSMRNLSDIKNPVQNCAAMIPGHTLAVSASPGSSFPWEGSVDGNAGSINTGNGNKLTEIPLVSWKCRGGMVLDFTLFHNSQTTYSDELGYGWTWTYDIYVSVSGSTATVHWGNGLCVPYTISGSTYTPPTGVYDSLVKNADNTWTITKKNQVKYRLNTSGFCDQIQDRNGNTITITLNAYNYATRVTDPSGRYIDIDVDSNNKFLGITDPLSRTWSFTINGSYDLTTVTWPTLNSTTYTDGFTYSSHRITRHTDRRGKYWDTAYYTDGSVNTEKDPLNHTTTYTYAAGATTISDPLSHNTVYSYSSGKLSGITDPCNYSVGYTYDSAKNVTRVTDKRGKYWDYTYDSTGNVLTSQDPYDHTTTYTYNSKNDVLTVTDPLNNVTTNAYDSAGNLTSVTDGLNHATTYTVDSYGQVTAVTDALSRSTSMEYDTNGNLASTTDPLGHETEMTYNDVSLLTSTTNVLSNTESVDYDNWSRPITASHPDSSTVSKSYNAVGQVTAVADEESHTTTYNYDDAGRLTSVVNANNETESYGYDNADRRTTVTNGRGKVRTYAYNNRNEVTSLTLADNSVEQWSYNGNGDVTAYTSPLNQVIYYAYDDAGRKTGVDYPTGTDTAFSYDNASRQTQMTDSTGTTSWTYDNANRLTGLNTPQGNMTYTYTNANQRATMVESAGTTSYTYDDAGRLTQLTNWNSETTSWTYDNANRTTRQTFASGAYTNYGYDSQNRQTSVSHKKSDGTVLSSESYVYDDAGNMSSKTVDSTTTTYGYDNIDQLTSEARTGYTCSYTYDANGNRLTKTLNNVTESYTYDDADKMLTAGSKSYTYDAAGRTTAVAVGNDTTTLSYDYEGRLTQIVYPNSATNTFTYNGLDTRVGKVDSAGTKTFKRDGAGVTDALLSDGNSVYTPSISVRTSGATKFMHSDFQKSVTSETSSAQATTATRTYDAFGLMVASSGSSASPFGFAGGYGYQEDPDSGLKLLGHRYYDPSTGRFLTQDHIKDGRNWYAYCENNPCSFIDCDGNKTMLIIIGAPYKDKDKPTDGCIGGAPGLAGKYADKYRKFGWKIAPILVEPTEKQVKNAAKNKDGVIYIGHGNDRNNFGRLQGKFGTPASQRFTAKLLPKSLDILILESCHLGSNANKGAWKAHCEKLYAYPSYGVNFYERTNNFGDPNNKPIEDMPAER